MTRNACTPERTAGGSSGGAAVALALRMLAVADGSDAMGSLRNPAGYNNLLGFRPSWGRVPGGAAPDVFYQQLSTEGPMARSVADLAMLLATLAGHDDRAPLSIAQSPDVFERPLSTDVRGRRVAWLGDLGGYLAIEPEVLALCRSALEVLEDLDCVVEEALPEFPFERMWDAWTTLRSLGQAGRHREAYADPDRRALLKPEIVWEVERGMAFSGLDFHAAALDRSAWYMALLAFFKRYDYFAQPSAQLLPFPAELDWPGTSGPTGSRRRVHHVCIRRVSESDITRPNARNSRHCAPWSDAIAKSRRSHHRCAEDEEARDHSSSPLACERFTALEMSPMWLKACG